MSNIWWDDVHEKTSYHRQNDYRLNKLKIIKNQNNQNTEM